MCPSSVLSLGATCNKVPSTLTDSCFSVCALPKEIAACLIHVQYGDKIASLYLRSVLGHGWFNLFLYNWDFDMAEVPDRGLIHCLIVW